MNLKTATNLAIVGFALISLVSAYYCFQIFASVSSTSEVLKHATPSLIHLIGWIGIFIFFIVLRKNQK